MFNCGLGICFDKTVACWFPAISGLLQFVRFIFVTTGNCYKANVSTKRS